MSYRIISLSLVLPLVIGSIDFVHAKNKLGVEYQIGPSLQYFYKNNMQNILFGIHIGVNHRVNFTRRFFVSSAVEINTFIKQVLNGEYDGINIKQDKHILKYLLQSKKNIQISWNLQLGGRIAMPTKSALDITGGAKLSISGYSISHYVSQNADEQAELLNSYWNDKNNGYQKARMAYKLQNIAVTLGRKDISDTGVTALHTGVKKYKLQAAEKPVLSGGVSRAFKAIDIRKKGMIYTNTQQAQYGNGHLWSLDLGPSMAMMIKLPQTGSLSVALGMQYDLQIPIYQFHASGSEAFLPNMIYGDKIGIKPLGLRMSDDISLGTQILKKKTKTENFDISANSFSKEIKLSIKEGENKGANITIPKGAKLPLTVKVKVAKKDQPLYIRQATAVIVSKNNDKAPSSAYTSKDIAEILLYGAEKIYSNINHHNTHSISFVIRLKY